MFMIGGIIHLAGAVFYLIFASGERQSWAQPDNQARPPDVAEYDDHFAEQAWGAESDPLYPGRGGAKGGDTYGGTGYTPTSASYNGAPCGSLNACDTHVYSRSVY